MVREKNKTATIYNLLILILQAFRSPAEVIWKVSRSYVAD